MWHVVATGVPEDANIKVGKVIVDQWEFPVFQNHKKLSKFDKLIYFDKALQQKDAKKRKIA